MPQTKLKNFAVFAALLGLCPVAAQAQAKLSDEPLRSGEQVHDENGVRRVRLDIVICVDSTGSMGDEIGVVKTRLKEMVAKISNGTPKPVVRFGVVTYRDRGDDYITRKFALSTDIPKVNAFIDTIQAEGGGDGPESVNEGLHVAVEEMNWDVAPGVARMIFLIGDAAPHMDYGDDYDFRDEITAAITRHITINTIACSGLNEYSGDEVTGGFSGPDVWQQIALRTEGRFDDISYFGGETSDKDGKHEIVNEGGQAYIIKASARGRWREGGKRLAAEGLASVSGGAGADRSHSNLDFLLTRDVQTMAQKYGVSYADSVVAQTVRGRTLAHGARSGLTDARKEVVRDEASWQKLWQMHAAGFANAPALPKVDFAHQSVVAIALGRKDGPGWAVQISGIERKGERAIVRYQIVAPKLDPKAAKTTVQPFHFVVVPKLPDAVTFAPEEVRGGMATA